MICDEDATLDLKVRTVKYFKELWDVHSTLNKEATPDPNPNGTTSTTTAWNKLAFLLWYFYVLVVLQCCQPLWEELELIGKFAVILKVRLQFLMVKIRYAKYLKVQLAILFFTAYVTCN